jgi:hypothetical protein
VVGEVELGNGDDAAETGDVDAAPTAIEGLVVELDVVGDAIEGLVVIGAADSSPQVA